MKQSTFPLLVACLLALFLSSCQKTEEPILTPEVTQQEQEKPETFTLNETKAITTDHELMQSFRTSEDFQHIESSKLNWDAIQLATYQNSEMKALIIPYKERGPKKFLYASYLNNNFNSIVMEMDFSYDELTGLAGSFSLYSMDGEKIATANYMDNKLVDIQEFAIGRCNNYWAACIGHLFNSMFPSLPWWIQIGCEAVVIGCIAIPNPIVCGAAIGCVGGYVAGIVALCTNWHCF